MKRGLPSPSAAAGGLAELAAGLVALAGSFASAVAITGSIASGSSGRACEGGRRLAGVGEQGGGGARPLERGLAGQALVEHAAERVDVGALVGGSRAICSGAV